MVFKKAPFGPPFRPSERKQINPPNDPGGPSRDPAFHDETFIITVPFGPSVFLKLIYLTKIGFLLFFELCFICYSYDNCC